MKKYFFFAATALVLSACTSDEFVGQEKTEAEGDANVIAFKTTSSKFSRATLTGGEAATKLNNQFVVYGTKHVTSAEDKTATNDALVYQNYVVNYTASTANTTESNTADWEYVGQTPYAAAKVGPSSITEQSIKYWDYSAANGYTFYAFSAKPDDIEDGHVIVTKTTAGSNNVYEKGYSITLDEDASMDDLYFADRVVIAKSTNAVHGADNQFGGEVNFTFRNAATKVRVGMYETVPGYKVTIDKFYYVNDADPDFDDMTTAGTDKFYANLANCAQGTAGTLTVTYYDNTTAIPNQPKVTFSGTAAKYLALGDNLKATTDLATNNTTPTYDKTAGAYTTVFPQESNTQNLKLKLDYTLTSTDGSGEVIKVKSATAEVPAALLAWKPNFAYTYLFKISNNTNGSTGTVGTDPAGLYPITFDAAVVEAENGEIADYITTVSEPSITTFGVSGGKYVKANDDYTTSADIYVTFMEGSSVVTPVLSGGSQNVAVYKITDAGVTIGATEAQVAEWVANSKTTYYESAASKASIAATVPGEDGVNITSLANKAVKLTGLTAGTYAVEYTASSAWTGAYTKVYKVIIVK